MTGKIKINLLWKPDDDGSGGEIREVQYVGDDQTIVIDWHKLCWDCQLKPRRALNCEICKSLF